MKKFVLSLALVSGLLMGVPVHGVLFGGGNINGTSPVPSSSNSQATTVPSAWLPRIAARTGIPLRELIELRNQGHVTVDSKGTISILRVNCPTCSILGSLTTLTEIDI